ncbi:MAG: hypothetical protein ACRELE_04765 [Gemmatimonadales bacterium]
MTLRLDAGRVAGARLASTLAALCITLAAACADQLGAGDTLSGHWNNSDARLDASRDSVVFTARCQRATFGPIVLDSNYRFLAESVVFTEIGNLNFPPGDRLRISGTVTDGQISLSVLLIRTSPPVNDPLFMILKSGVSGDPLVCNA